MDPVTMTYYGAICGMPGAGRRRGFRRSPSASSPGWRWGSWRPGRCRTCARCSGPDGGSSDSAVGQPSKKPGPARPRSTAAASAPSASASATAPASGVGEALRAVGAQDLAAQAQPVAVELGEAGDRRVAGAVEPGEEGALGGEALAGGGVVDRREQGRDALVAAALLDADRALRDGGQHLVRVDRSRGTASRPRRLQPGHREEGGGGDAVGELAQPGLDAAAERDDGDVRPAVERLGPAAQAGGAEDAARPAGWRASRPAPRRRRRGRPRAAGAR